MLSSLQQQQQHNIIIKYGKVVILLKVRPFEKPQSQMNC